MTFVLGLSIHPASRPRASNSNLKNEVSNILSSYLRRNTVCEESVDMEPCLVEYLQVKGKLDSSSFKSYKEQSLMTLLGCVYKIPVLKAVAGTMLKERIKIKIPNHSDCLINKFDSLETLDLTLKIWLLSLQNGDMRAELEPTSRALREDLNTIMSYCETNDRMFLKIFSDYLENKNATSTLFEQDYCIKKYVADNKILVFTNVELDPTQIDTENLDCDEIIDELRYDSDKELSDKLSSLPNGRRILGCVQDAYETEDDAASIILLKVLFNFKGLKEAGKVRLTQKLCFGNNHLLVKNGISGMLKA